MQGKIINYLIENNTPNVLFYDDGSNELADLIGFWIDEESRKIIMRLYHCKYAIGAKSSIGGEFKHEVRQFEKSYDNQQAEQISLMV